MRSTDLFRLPLRWPLTTAAVALLIARHVTGMEVVPHGLMRPLILPGYLATLVVFPLLHLAVPETWWTGRLASILAVPIWLAPYPFLDYVLRRLVAVAMKAIRATKENGRGGAR